MARDAEVECKTKPQIRHALHCTSCCLHPPIDTSPLLHHQYRAALCVHDGQHNKSAETWA